MKTGTMYSGSTNSKRTRRAVSPPLAFFALLSLWSSVGVDGFTQQPVAKIRRILQRIARSTTSATTTTTSSRRLSFTTASCHEDSHNQKNGRTLIDAFREIPFWKHATNVASGIAVGGFISSMVLFSGPVWAENELSDKYGGGLDTSLVDQTCLVDKCSLQAKACLKDDPSCRKGLTCTAKCLGDNACITGCMARYGNQNLDRLLKCTIEDHECIKVAILPGGSDKYGQEPRAPGPTVQNFDPRSLEGSWYKVVGYNPNYDCYACQRNSFKAASSSNPFVPVLMNGNNKLDMEVEFSMPRLLPDGSPPPPSNNRELIRFNEDNGEVRGIQSSIALNDYYTRETMVFDRGAPNPLTNLKWTNKQGEVTSYARTAHSEGEMFGLKFWENWYVLGENDPDSPEFKFIYYNGKTRQNTYEGAFVYSRTKELSPESMMKVYRIAQEAGMDPNQFCRIRNGCFRGDDLVKEPTTGLGSPSNPFRGILASTKVSEFLGVQRVEARDSVRRSTPTAEILNPPQNVKRAWWYEVGDYLENPHRHFNTMDKLRVNMEWPEEVKNQAK